MSSESGGGDPCPLPGSEMSEVQEVAQVHPPVGVTNEREAAGGTGGGDSGLSMGIGSGSETQQQQLEMEDEVRVLDDVTMM